MQNIVQIFYHANTLKLLGFMDKFDGVLVENTEEIGYLRNRNYNKKIVYGTVGTISENALTQLANTYGV